MAVLELDEDIGSYLNPADRELVRKAYLFAAKAHAQQKRLSGEDFIEHPVAVARILSELEGDAQILAAALLHDVVEDTPVKIEDIRNEFGEEIAKLVDGVTKLSRIEFRSRVEEQVSNLRKMFLAMAEDWRVVVIRLADRLHNLRTLGALPLEKQKSTAEETLEIYAPLAHRLGIWRFKWELEDLAFRYLEPEEYYSLARRIQAKRSQREAEAAMVIQKIKDKLTEEGIHFHDVLGRAKNLYSIYKKMRTGGRDLSDIYDLLAVRVIVDSVTDCYEVLGIVHTLWKPMPGRFKDYIAMPKPNGYQSLHTTVVGPLGEPFEIQIRTKEMDRTAEYGSAAHWRYKEGGKFDKSFDQKMAWLRQLLDWQREMTDAGEFMEALKIDVFNDEVFVFTPKGDVVDLPVGSCPLDFAYKIHTDIGHHCVGARVNGKMVPLGQKLNTGDIVEILTSRQSTGPSRDWLDLVKSPQARSKIKAFFKRQLREEDLARGKAMVEKELKKLGLRLENIEEKGIVSTVLERLRYPDLDNLWAAVAYGGISPVHVATRIKEEVARVDPGLLPQKESVPKVQEHVARVPEEAIVVKGMKNFLVRLAHCCNPVPGDPIIGYITRGRGVTVHRLDCPALENYQDKERFIEVSWEKTEGMAYPVEVVIEGKDRPGLFADVTSVIASLGANIVNAKAKGGPDGKARIVITFQVHNLDELKKASSQIKQIKGIDKVQRTSGRTKEKGEVDL